MDGEDMIIDKKIKIKISHNNRRKYEDKLGINLNNNQDIYISQIDLLPTSRTEVECICDNCNSTFFRKRVSIKGKLTLCSKSCRNNYFKKLYKTEENPNPRKDKIKVHCRICNDEIEVVESKFKKQKFFLCSRECYRIHRSIEYSGENTYNYQDIIIKCEMCDKDIKTSKWYLENKNHLFCSQECYWMHRSKFYKEFYYENHLNDHRGETKPERLVREWLERNDINFKQECGFLRKYYVDFYLPDYKMIIEVYGDYWHVNPEVYDIYGNDKNKKPLTDMQREKIKSNYDNIRRKELESYGIIVEIIWEKDILEDLDTNMSKIFKQFSKNP